MVKNGLNKRELHTISVLCMQDGLVWLKSFPKARTPSECAELALAVDGMLKWEYATMKRDVRTDEGSKGANWTRFVDIPLAGYTIGDIDDRYGTWDVFSADLSVLFRSGYRVGLSYNEGNHAFVASVTCRASGDPNEGCTFTAFAGSWEKALQVAAFKHFVIADGVWVGTDVSSDVDLIG